MKPDFNYHETGPSVVVVVVVSAHRAWQLRISYQALGHRQCSFCLAINRRAWQLGDGAEWRLCGGYTESCTNKDHCQSATYIIPGSRTQTVFLLLGNKPSLSLSYQAAAHRTGQLVLSKAHNGCNGCTPQEAQHHVHVLYMRQGKVLPFRLPLCLLPSSQVLSVCRYRL